MPYASLKETQMVPFHPRLRHPTPPPPSSSKAYVAFCRAKALLKDSAKHGPSNTSRGSTAKSSWIWGSIWKQKIVSQHLAPTTHLSFPCTTKDRTSTTDFLVTLTRHLLQITTNNLVIAIWSAYFRRIFKWLPPWKGNLEVFDQSQSPGPIRILPRVFGVSRNVPICYWKNPSRYWTHLDNPPKLSQQGATEGNILVSPWINQCHQENPLPFSREAELFEEEFAGPSPLHPATSEGWHSHPNRNGEENESRHLRWVACQKELL